MCQSTSSSFSRLQFVDSPGALSSTLTRWERYPITITGAPCKSSGELLGSPFSTSQSTGMYAVALGMSVRFFWLLSLIIFGSDELPAAAQTSCPPMTSGWGTAATRAACNWSSREPEVGCTAGLRFDDDMLTFLARTQPIAPSAA